VSSYKVGVIGGDGIGPEVTAEALKVVRAAGVSLDTTDYELGADHYIRTGEVLPDRVLDELAGQEAILLGAIGAPIGSTEVPPGTLERGMLLRLRFALDLYINLRPFTGVPGAPAAGCDFVVIRENTEGTYAGEGGFLRKGTPFEVATQGSVNTRHGVERCARYAFALAATRPERHLTLVHKTNVLTFAGDLWQRTVEEVAPEYPDVSWDYNHVDATCIYLVENPGRYDVIVTDNLFGDIITDLATRPRPTSIPTGRAPPCSSRYTVRPTTSPGPAGPTRPPPSARPPSCWTSWARPRPPPPSSRRSPNSSTTPPT
jgi:3-isopropylmalate dehydrogenase